MSIGNLKDTGNQGNNLPYQWKVLQGLQAILDEVTQPLTCVEDSVTICNENIDALTFTDILGVGESLNVNIANTIPLEVNLDPDNDSVGIYGYTNPANPATFTGIKVDASGVLAIQDNGGSITVDGTVALDSATLTALENITVQNGAGAAAVNIQDGGNSITIDATALPLPTGAATEATLLDVKTSVQLIDDCVGTDNTAAPAKSFVVAGVTAGGTQQTIEVNASGHVNISDGGGSITVDSNAVVRTPTFLRPAGTDGTVAAGTYSMSFASVGTANATVGGITLKPGETLNFDAGAINNTLGAVSYVTSAPAGAELIIITLT